MTKDGKISNAIIGVGACGGMLAELGAVAGLGEGFLLNSSREDLNATKGIDLTNRVKFGSIEGAAKNRAVAYEAIKKEHARFLDVIETRLITTELDNLFVAFSGGGGTGSGASPVILKLLKTKYPKINVIPIVVLPAAYEKAIIQQNALDCIRELVSDMNRTIIVVDNSKITTDSGLILEKYTKINTETINNIRKLVSSEKTSRISNIDVADRQSMLTEPGILVIGSATVDITAENPLLAAVKRAIESTPMQADITNSVARAAIQYECDGSVYTEKNISEAQSLFKNVGGIFEGFYDSEKSVDADGKPNNVVTVAFSGARFSEKWIKERETLVADMFKVEKKEALNISQGNSGLKSQWGSAGGNSQTSSAATSESLDNVFADFEEARK